MPAEIVVIGQIARDLVLRVAQVPGPGASAGVRSRQEVLGGKGANQAVAFAQLGLPVALVGVVGRDRAGDALLSQARADRVDTTHVVRRDGAATALIVDVVDDDGRWHYLEDVAEDVLLTERDVLAAAPLISAAGSVVLQLQQPLPALWPPRGWPTRPAPGSCSTVLRPTRTAPANCSPAPTSCAPTPAKPSS